MMHALQRIEFINLEGKLASPASLAGEDGEGSFSSPCLDGHRMSSPPAGAATPLPLLGFMLATALSVWMWAIGATLTWMLIG